MAKKKPAGLNDLVSDHRCFKKAIDQFKEHVEKIEKNTAATPEILTKLHADNNKHLEIIAGKKQVPLSIFTIIVVFLVGIAVATEVKYSGVQVDIGWDHFKITTSTRK